MGKLTECLCEKCGYPLYSYSNSVCICEIDANKYGYYTAKMSECMQYKLKLNRNFFISERRRRENWEEKKARDRMDR